MGTDQSWTRRTLCLARFFFDFLFVYEICFCCHLPPVGVVALKWLPKPLRADRLRQSDYITEMECQRSVWSRPSLSLFPLSHCLNLSQSPQRERWLRGFSANDETSVCEPPSPTSPSPLPTPHHMMAWVGLPLWVTQLWGAVLVRPLSPVSEPRLMIAGDDPVVFPSSHTPLLPLFYLFICLFLNHLISIFYFSLSTWVSEIVLLCKRHISIALELADFSFPALPAHKIL